MVTRMGDLLGVRAFFLCIQLRLQGKRSSLTHNSSDNDAQYQRGARHSPHPNPVLEL